MSVEKLVITHEQKPFTTHLNSVLQNLRNPEALGLWCYLSSLPPTWNVSKTQLRNHFGIGQDKLDKILKNLKEKGLLEIRKIRDCETGLITGWAIHVKAGIDFKQDSIQDAENTPSGIQEGCFPEPGKPQGWKTVAIKEIDNKENKKLQRERLPDNFEPDKDHLELAKQFSLDVRYELDKFKDWAKSDGTLKLNWKSTFSNWLRRANEYKSKDKKYTNNNNETKSTIKEWTKGNPDYDRVHGITH